MGALILTLTHVENYANFLQINRDLMIGSWLVIIIIFAIISYRLSHKKLKGKVNWAGDSKTAKTYQDFLKKETKKDSEYPSKFFIDPKQRKLMSVKKIWTDNALAETTLQSILLIIFIGLLVISLSIITDTIVGSDVKGYLVFNGALILFAIYSIINDVYKIHVKKEENKKTALFSGDLSNNLEIMTSFNKSIKSTVAFCILVLSFIMSAFFALALLNSKKDMIIIIGSLIILLFFLYILSKNFRYTLNKFLEKTEGKTLPKNGEHILLLSILIFLASMTYLEYLKSIPSLIDYTPIIYTFNVLSVSLLFISSVFFKKDSLTNKRSNIIWLTALLYLFLVALLSDFVSFLSVYYVFTAPIIVVSLFLNIFFTMATSFKKDISTEESFNKYRKTILKVIGMTTLTFFIMSSFNWIDPITLKLSNDVDLLWLSTLGAACALFNTAFLSLYIMERKRFKQFHKNKEKIPKKIYVIPPGLKGPYTENELKKKLLINTTLIGNTNPELNEIDY